MTAVAIVVTEQEHGTGAYRILRHLLEHAGRELPDIHLIAPASNPLYRDCCQNKIPASPLPARRDKLLLNMVGFWRIREAVGDCAVVHAWHSRGFELAAMASFLGNKVTTVTLHDHPSDTTHSRQRQLVTRWSLRRVHAAVSVSRALETEWRRYLGDQKCITVIHNGIPDFAVHRRPGDKVRVGFAGLYSPMKGLEVLIKWITGIGKEAAVSWLLFGKPHPEVDRVLRSSGVAGFPHVKIMGHRAPEEIFSQIDILVHPSCGFDSLPTSLIEAACAGIPVVASSIGGALEIVEHGRSGFLFSPDCPDKGMSYLKTLIQSRELREQMGAAARSIYDSRFRVERMVQEYAQFWRRLADLGNQSGKAKGDEC